MAGSPMRRKRYKVTRTPPKLANPSVNEKPTADAQAAGKIKAVLDQKAEAAEVKPAVNGEVKTAEFEPDIIQEDKTAEVEPAISHKVKTAEVEPAVNQQVKTAEVEPAASHEVETAKVKPAVNREVKATEAKAAVNHKIKTVELECAVSHEIETVKVEPAVNREADLAINHELKTTEVQPAVNHEVKTTTVESAIKHDVKTANFEPAANHKFKASKAKPVLKPTIGVSPDDCVPAAKNRDRHFVPSDVQSTRRGHPGDNISAVGTRKPPSKPRAPPKNGTKAKTAVPSGRSALEIFKSGEPDPPVVADMLRRLEAGKQSNAAVQKNKMNKTSNANPKPTVAALDILSGSKSPGRGAKKPCPRKRAHSPVDEGDDGDIGEDYLDQFGTNICRDGQWWVEPIIGEAFPKRPEFSTWCQSGDQCLGLRDFHCLLRHEYQDDYWFARKANLGSLPVDPEGLGSRDPPFKHDDKPLVAPSPFSRYTGHIKGAARDSDWAKAKAGSRFRRR